MLAYNLLIVLAFLVGELLLGAAVCLPVVHAVNTWQLPLFLLANVLTGAVNGSTDTLAASHATAWAVMAGYLAVLGAAVMGVHAVAARRATRRRKAS